MSMKYNNLSICSLMLRDLQVPEMMASPNKDEAIQIVNALHQMQSAYNDAWRREYEPTQREIVLRADMLTKTLGDAIVMYEEEGQKICLRRDMINYAEIKKVLEPYLLDSKLA